MIYWFDFQCAMDTRKSKRNVSVFYQGLSSSSLSLYSLTQRCLAAIEKLALQFRPCQIKISRFICWINKCCFEVPRVEIAPNICWKLCFMAKGYKSLLLNSRTLESEMIMHMRLPWLWSLLVGSVLYREFGSDEDWHVMTFLFSWKQWFKIFLWKNPEQHFLLDELLVVNPLDVLGFVWPFRTFRFEEGLINQTSYNEERKIIG